MPGGGGGGGAELVLVTSNHRFSAEHASAAVQKDAKEWADAQGKRFAERARVAWEKRVEAFGKWVAQEQPAVVALQEDAPGVAQELCDAADAANRALGVPFERAKYAYAAKPPEDGAWEVCAIMYNTAVVREVRHGRHSWADHRGERIEQMDGPMAKKMREGGVGSHRIALSWVVFETVETSQTFAVSNTHLESGHDWDLAVVPQKKSAKKVLEYVKALKQSVGELAPVFLCGDFNNWKWGPVWSILTGKHHGNEFHGLDVLPEEPLPNVADLLEAYSTKLGRPSGDTVLKGREPIDGSCPGSTWHQFDGVRASVENSENCSKTPNRKMLFPANNRGLHGHERHIDWCTVLAADLEAERVEVLDAYAVVGTHAQRASDHFPVLCRVRLPLATSAALRAGDCMELPDTKDCPCSSP